MAHRRCLLWLATAVLAGCGAASASTPRPIAFDAAHTLPATPARVATALPVGDLRCSRAADERFGVHLELFVDGLVVLVPPGVGVAPPWIGTTPYVTGGRCSYPLRTSEPTGVIEVAPASRPLVLGDLFAIWGQPLSGDGFGRWLTASGERMGVFVNGRSFDGDPRSIPLRRHAQIVLELGTPRVPPHPSYLFAPHL